MYSIHRQGNDIPGTEIAIRCPVQTCHPSAAFLQEMCGLCRCRGERPVCFRAAPQLILNIVFPCQQIRRICRSNELLCKISSRKAGQPVIKDRTDLSDCVKAIAIRCPVRPVIAHRLNEFLTKVMDRLGTCKTVQILSQFPGLLIMPVQVHNAAGTGIVVHPRIRN